MKQHHACPPSLTPSGTKEAGGTAGHLRANVSERLSGLPGARTNAYENTG